MLYSIKFRLIKAELNFTAAGVYHNSRAAIGKLNRTFFKLQLLKRRAKFQEIIGLKVEHHTFEAEADVPAPKMNDA